MSPSSTKLSTATNCKESPPRNMPYLPDQLLLTCFARVSSLYYPTLSLVSKRFLSLVASLELYQTRTLLSRTESCLYVCLLDHCNKPRLFTLCKRPTLVVNPNPRSQWFSPFKNCITRKKERKPSHDNILVPLPSGNVPYFGGSYAIVGSNIYIIGGFIRNRPSSRVLFMDCRTHTWHEAPSMRIARRCPQLSVLDGKIYVMDESTKDCGSSGWIEVFDPITQTWEDVSGPEEEIAAGRVTPRSLSIKGKLYLLGDKEVVYKPKENKWEAIGLDMSIDEISGMFYGALLDSICEIDNIMYIHRFDKTLEWYDYETRSWKFVKGLEKLMSTLSASSGGVKLVNFGGKIGFFRVETTCYVKKIWCGVIALERRKKQHHEIYGKVEWFDLFTVPKSFHSAKLLVATV